MHRSEVSQYSGGPSFGSWLLRRTNSIRFAEVEATAVISMVLKRYKITVDETRFSTIPGESVVARRERLFATSQDLSLTPTNAPLVFTRRR